MQYWLRRNNNDSGPFSKEALLSQGLNSGDLVRIDGDAAWKTPNSFAELKSGLQGAPKPKYKFTADKKLIEIKEAEHQMPEAAPPKPELAAGPTPFKRMPSALPKKKTTIPPAVDHTAAVIAEKAKGRSVVTTREDKPEETSQAHVPMPVTATGHQKPHAHIQSIEEAPLRETRHQPAPKPIRHATRPQNSHFFKEFFLPIIIIGGIGFLAWWGFKQFTAPASYADVPVASTGSDSMSQQQNAGHPDGINSKPAQNNSAAAIPLHQPNGATGKDSLQQKAKSVKVVKDSSNTIKDIVRAKAATNPPAAKDVDNQSTAATDKAPGTAATAVASTTPTDKPAEKHTDSPTQTATKTVVAQKAPEKKQPEKKAPKASSISDYVNLSLNKTPESGIKNIKIKVHNTSKDDLNIAVIEVKYFDADNKFIQGETLQTGEIKGGKTATLKIPNNKNATRITYKVSLISGDNVYLMGK